MMYMNKLSKSGKETVSIILPTYNRAAYLNRSIDSIIKQSFRNWELIIIDDGSKDNTKEVLRPYLIQYSNIKYYYYSNKGVAASMNTGIKKSFGRFVTFIGSDDEYLPHHIKFRIEYFKENPDVDLIHSTAKIIGNKFVKDKNDLSKTIHLNECVLGGTLFGKRNVFQKMKGFALVNYSPESDFVERAKKEFVIRKLDIPSYLYYRDTPNSICNSI